MLPTNCNEKIFVLISKYSLCTHTFISLSATKSNFVGGFSFVKTWLGERSSGHATTDFEMCRRVVGLFSPVFGLARGARKCRKNSAQNYRHGKSGKERRPLEMPGRCVQTIIKVVTVGLKERKKSVLVFTFTKHTHTLPHNTFGWTPLTQHVYHADNSIWSLITFLRNTEKKVEKRHKSV